MFMIRVMTAGFEAITSTGVARLYNYIIWNASQTVWCSHVR